MSEVEHGTPAGSGRGWHRRLGRRTGVVTGAVVIVAAAVVGLVATRPAPSRDHGTSPGGTTTTAPHLPGVPGVRPAAMALAAYNSCGDLLTGLRTHAGRTVGPDGFPGSFGPLYDSLPMATAGGARSAQSASPDTSGGQDHSTTNVQEPGVDEPDIVKTDGTRIVTVTSGILRVVDTRSGQITGTLDLTLYANWQSAQLLLAGNRALVVLGSGGYGPGPIGIDYRGPGGSTTAASTYLLVDLSATPQVIGTFRPTGSHLDARMIGSTVRLVVTSAPTITFRHDGTDKQRLARNKAAVAEAPLSAWLPSYEVTTDGATTHRTVPCEQVSHPADYSGASMLTVYTLDLSRGLGDAHPVGIAADGDTVYATSSSLYVASNPDFYCCVVPLEGGAVVPPSASTPTASEASGAPAASGGSGTASGAPAVPKATPSVPPQITELHRFDISAPGAPTYLGSGSVPGRLLSQYSLSDYDGHLRVAATTGDFGSRTQTSVYVMDAQTLKLTGHVDGLGRGEQVYAVRFLGPLGYVVTFRQVDPLYVLDLHDPAAPRTAGELKITGFSNYLHPTADGRLVGIGQAATTDGRVTGLQVSLFDVSRPAQPRLTDHLTRPNAAPSYGGDPHAFLYWPSSGLLVVPIQSWVVSTVPDQPVPDPGFQAGQALVVRVSPDGLSTVGLLSHPATTYGSGIERSMVVGSRLWTLSEAGLLASDPQTLAKRAWVPYE